MLRIKELEKSLKEFNVKNESLIKEVEKNKSLMNERFKKDCEDYEQKLNAIIKEKESDKKNMKS